MSSVDSSMFSRRVDKFDVVSDEDSVVEQPSTPIMMKPAPKPGQIPLQKPVQKPAQNPVQNTMQIPLQNPVQKPLQIEYRQPPAPVDPQIVGKAPSESSATTCSTTKPEVPWPGNEEKLSSFGYLRIQKIKEYEAKQKAKKEERKKEHRKKDRKKKEKLYENFPDITVGDPEPETSQRSASVATSETQPDPPVWPHTNPHLSSFAALKIAKIKAQREQNAKKNAGLEPSEEETERQQIPELMAIDLDKNTSHRPYTEEPVEKKEQHSPAPQIAQEQAPLQNVVVSESQATNMPPPGQRPLSKSIASPAKIAQIRAIEPTTHSEAPMQQTQSAQQYPQIQKHRSMMQQQIQASSSVSTVKEQVEPYRAPEIDEATRLEDAYACSGCQTVVPHNQLFVCSKDTCPFSVQVQNGVEVPNQFFRLVKVFCGSCSFRGCHSAHQENMKEALPFAIKSASEETGGKLKAEFDKLITLNHDEPVDYMISEELMQEAAFKKIQVVEYLGCAPSVPVWHQRLTQLVDTFNTVIESRRGAYAHVLGLAEKALDYYQKLKDVIAFDLFNRKPQEAQKKKTHLEEHASTMGLPFDYYTNPKVFPESSLLTDHTDASPKVVRYLEDQARMLAELDAEVMGTEIGVVQQRVDQGAVKLTYIMMCRKYDMTRIRKTPKEAFEVVKNHLNTKCIPLEIKEAAADMFRKKMGEELMFSEESDEAQDAQDAQDQQQDHPEDVDSDKENEIQW